jgi:hypothetical protein
VNNNSKNGSRAALKKCMVSELRKGAKYIDPQTDEMVFVNFSDDECKGVGPSNGYTTKYIRKGEQMWNMAVELK